MANYYFTIPDSVTLPTDGNKVSLTTDCELHRDDSALPNALTVAADSYNVFLADTPGTGTATAPDVTAPTLSSPTAAKSGETGATSLGVSTNEGNGTLYWGIYPTASTPSAADVVAGTGATVNGSQAVSGTGVQSVSDQTGLTAGTAYKAHYVQDDAASNRSSVATSSEFTTDAAVTAFTDDFSGFTTGDDIGVDTANYDNAGSNTGQGKFEVTASDTAGMETGVNGGRIFQYIGTSPVVQNTDHFAEVEVTDIGSDSDSGHSFYVIVRAVDEDNWVGMRFYQDRMVGIYRRDNGSVLSNPSASLETPATDVNPIASGDVFKIEAVGDTVMVYRNGSSVCSWTHSDLDIGGKFETGRPGLAATAAGAVYNTPFRIEYFKCGNA